MYAFYSTVQYYIELNDDTRRGLNNLLRQLIYLQYICLGDARVRSALLHAASSYSAEWLTW
jgi:hypothetical protein